MQIISLFCKMYWTVSMGYEKDKSLCGEEKKSIQE